MRDDQEQGWRRQIRKGLVLGAIGLGLIPAALLGLWAVMSTTPPLYPDPQALPSEAGAPPLARWADAVAQSQAVVRAAMAERSLPGISVAVGVDGDVVWAEGFGWADLEQRVAVAPDTRFRIGTASMALTSAAVGLLIEQGRMTLDDVIQTHVPAFPAKPWPVTVRQLMGHVAGVNTDGGDEGPLLATPCDRPVDGLPAFADRPLLFEPGTRFSPSSYGWILVSAAVEAAAGESLPAFMRDRIFRPLGMTGTRPDSRTEPVPGRATSYFPRFAADPRYGLHLMRELDYSCYAGASAFLSTPSDLVRFAMALEHGALLQPATVQQLHAGQRLASGEETGYGLGWDLETTTLAGRDTRLIGHDGDALGGMVASFMTFPDHGITVSVTSNISYADTFTIAVDVARSFAGRDR